MCVPEILASQEGKYMCVPKILASQESKVIKKVISKESKIKVRSI